MGLYYYCESEEDMYALRTIMTMDTIGVDNQEPRTHLEALLGLITKFYPVLKLPHKQATVACAMRSSHSTPGTIMAMT